MSRLVIAGGQVLVDRAVQPGSVAIDDGVITAIAPGLAVAADTPVIDADGLLVAPGFVDLQINGGFGLDLLSNPAALWPLGRKLPATGVTSFLPTIITSPATSVEAAMAAGRRRPPDHLGAEPLGLHLEGPMLNPARPGVHPVADLRPPGADVIAGWSRAAGIRLVTIAPELPGAGPVIADLRERGVVVAAGHSAADATDAAAAAAAGVSLVTHLFNAMEPLGHRAPNLVGTALVDERLAASLIVDGVHVDPAVIRLAWVALGPDRLVLITDAVAPMGCGPGSYEFAGAVVTADDRSVRTADGTLAGSSLTMDRAVRNLVAFTGCDPADALRAASTVPADLLAEPDRGRLRPGAVADVVLLDERLEVQLTLCGGRPAFVAPGAVDRVGDGLAADADRSGDVGEAG